MSQADIPLVFEVVYNPESTLYLTIIWVDEDDHVNQATMFSPWHLGNDYIISDLIPAIDRALNDDITTHRRDKLLIRKHLAKMTLVNRTVGIEAPPQPPFQGVVTHD